jgi:hypothetical protein
MGSSRRERNIIGFPFTGGGGVLAYAQDTITIAPAANLQSTHEDKDFVHLAMELCAGGELFDSIVEAGNFSEKKAAKVRGRSDMLLPLHLQQSPEQATGIDKKIVEIMRPFLNCCPFRRNCRSSARWWRS